MFGVYLKEGKVWGKVLGKHRGDDCSDTGIASGKQVVYRGDISLKRYVLSSHSCHRQIFKIGYSE